MTLYLNNRTYNVIFCGIESRIVTAPSDVPQGSHLDPLLFILALDDVSLVLGKSKMTTWKFIWRLYRHKMLSFFKPILTPSRISRNLDSRVCRSNHSRDFQCRPFVKIGYSLLCKVMPKNSKVVDAGRIDLLSTLGTLFSFTRCGYNKKEIPLCT